ncbi:MAG: VWA domain-containing protein [Acidobacteria bacterium]|nr:VWA domain-containing protein [Acidobacteriota bacterium]
MPLWPALAAGQVQPPIRVESALVSVPVIVGDSQGRFVPGLTAEDFRLYQDGIEQKIDLFATSDQPTNIALLLDTSRSTVSVLGKIKKAAGQFLSQMRPQDRATVVTFDSEVRLLSPLTSDRERLEEAVKSAQVAYYEGTKLRDAIVEVITRRFKQLDERKAIILLTDGDDIGSVTPVSDLLDLVADSGTVVYSVYYRVDPRQTMKRLFGVSSRLPSRRDSPSAARQTEGEQFLKGLSELSTGRVFASEVGKLKKAFEAVSEELRHQYLLGFYPDRSELDGLVHELSVSVEKPGAIVRSRRFYRAMPRR